MITCSIAVLVACTVFAIYDVTTFRRSLAAELGTVARISGSNVTAALTFGDTNAANEILSSLSIQRHIVEACVYRADGTALAEYRRDGSKKVFAVPPLLPDQTLIVSRNMLVFRGIWLDGELIGSIYVKSDLGELHARIARFSEIILAAFLLSLVASFLLASRLQRLISEPIGQLARTASEVSLNKDYSLRVARGNDDEIGFLVDKFNEMLEQIEHRESALQYAHDGLERRVDQRTRELQKEVADRTRAEQELEERKRFLNSLIENIPLAIVATGSNDKVQMCNPAFEALFRYSQQAVLGRPLAGLITNSELRAEIESTLESLREGKSVHLVTRRSRGDGSLVDVEAYSVPLGLENKRTGALMLYQDITERKMAEKAMSQAREAAEAASKAKSEFLANMSHEIRTPMNGIMGMTELTLETDLNAEQREYLGMVKTSADSLLKLLNDILDFSKIEAGKLDLDFTEFPLRQSLGETLKTLGLRAHQKSLELAWQVADEVPDYLVGDLGRLRQIIINLIGNALKFTEQGEVFLLVEKVRDSSEEVELHFSVRDTGIGIAKDKQSEIFAPFTQADGSTTRLYGGTGLGLGIATRLVEMTGGKIWVESELGRGSTFHFTIRFGIAEDKNREQKVPDPEILQDSHVLIVDDNQTNRTILLEMLTQWGLRAEAVSGARPAIAALEQSRATKQHFDLVITDLHMPEADGFDLVEKMRGSPAFDHLPVIMLSSGSQRSDRERCRELAIAACLMKPVQPSELLDALLNELTRAIPERTKEIVERKFIDEKRPVLKVLLAEDNPVNRLLARRLLEKYGNTVSAVENGKEALAAIARERPDLVLMDVQMPVMDGLDAIRAVRANEHDSSDHLPIIALTAHAMKGDRERCLGAGADEYLTKPIRAAELFAALGRMKTGNVGPTSPAPIPVALSSPSVDRADSREVLHRVGYQENLEELGKLFAEGCPKIMEGIRRSLEMSDGIALEQLARSLQNFSVGLGAPGISRAAEDLQKLARSGYWIGAREVFKGLEQEVARLYSELSALQRTGPS
ncbi:MAG TPA: response regulator [Candidatus Acidoferrales bacterium]|nr:response regulator [Candidatus Acidoferrales bacterium]